MINWAGGTFFKRRKKGRRWPKQRRLLLQISPAHRRRQAWSGRRRWKRNCVDERSMANLWLFAIHESAFSWKHRVVICISAFRRQGTTSNRMLISRRKISFSRLPSARKTKAEDVIIFADSLSTRWAFVFFLRLFSMHNVCQFGEDVSCVNMCTDTAHR